MIPLIVFPIRLTDEENDILMGRKWEHIPSRIPEENRLEILEGNLRLVPYVIQNMRLLDIDTNDLISIGVIGFRKGINRFNPRLKTKLSSYCARCIQNEIYMYLRKDSQEHLDICYLYEPITEDDEGDQLTYIDILSTSDNILDGMMKKHDSIILQKLLDNLPPKHKLIIEYRYIERLKFKEIAKIIGTSGCNISKIHRKIIERLRIEYNALERK